MQMLKCAICGKEIPAWNSKNPDPLCSDPKRCCDECFSEKVIPARAVMIGQKEEEEIQITVKLSKEFDLWRLERIRDELNRNGDPEDYDFTIEDVVRDLLDEAIVEKVRSLS